MLRASTDLTKPMYLTMLSCYFLLVFRYDTISDQDSYMKVLEQIDFTLNSTHSCQFA